MIIKKYLLASFLLVFLTFATSSHTQADYLPEDLRARVDQLKVDIESQPTNPSNAKARANLLWEWINAHSLTGGYVPVDATRIVASVLAGNPTYPQLDPLTRELAFIDTNPTGLGTLSADVGPYTANSMATITQTFVVGDEPIESGGGFILARHFMTNFGDWQTDEPSQPNYITISSDNNKVSFVATTRPMAGMHGGFRTQRETLTFRIASGTLEPGDIVTFTYGDNSQGGPGMRIPTFSSDRMPLPIYVQFHRNGDLMSLPIQPIQVVGNQIAGVHGFAPSIVKPNEIFEISVRGQDAFYNRARGAIPDWEVLLGEDVWLNITTTGAITVVETSIAEPGVYYPTIRSTDRKITGRFNPILVTDEDRPRIYWGDTHGHSGFAEGVGTPDRFMTWARDDARLDYVTHSEHDVWMDDYEWEVLRENVINFTQEGKFIAYLGYEWTVYGPAGGHHNVLFRSPLDRVRVPSQFFPTLSKLYVGLRNAAKSRDVVVIPHAHQAGDYRLSDPELEPLIEIMSQHGNFEWFGRMYLDQGHQVGFTAASDNHLSQPGYSAPLGGSLSQQGGLGAILAREKTTDGIFDAMKNLQSYATTGDRIILDFDVNGTTMGKRAVFAKERQVSGRVIGTAPIRTISVVKNDGIVWEKNYYDRVDDRIVREDTFILSFETDSQPIHRGDNPRGWRWWEGVLRVNSAELVSIEPIDANLPFQQASKNQDGSAQIRTMTRGDSSSFLVKLDGVSRNTTLALDLVERRETGGAPPIYRPPQRVPATSFLLPLKDMTDGVVGYDQQVDDYTDRVRLTRQREDTLNTISFEFTDQGESQGDYYYVRVIQANDAIAWSSPVWIGGHAPR